jgi:peptidoglycan/xylan/chitin deacetylase (PgdA/CDA1 family)
MLHRFSDPEEGVQGLDPGFLRKALESLQAHRVPLLSLRAVVDRLNAGRTATGVAFTVDDGYYDFHRVAAPVFRDLDCPVTVFLTTGFIDGRGWFWWDKLSYAFRLTGRNSVRLPGSEMDLDLTGPVMRAEAVGRAIQWVKTLPEGSRGEGLDGLLARLEVDVPDHAPPAFSPMSWDQIKTQSQRNVDFGPHTVTHPSLATSNLGTVRDEVLGSFGRLREELEDPLPVFCYPFGTHTDVTTEVARIVESLGLEGAVTAIPGYAITGGNRRTEPYLIPRFSMPTNLVDVDQIAFGFERFKEILRSGLGRRG